MLVCGCEESGNRSAKAETTPELDDCRQDLGDYFLYQTAAGFSLKVPKDLQVPVRMGKYNFSGCKLINLDINFAWIHRTLILLPSASKYKKLNLPKHYETLRLYISFENHGPFPESYNSRNCISNKQAYEIPKYKIIICPGGHMLPGFNKLGTFPFLPRFELMDIRDTVIDFECSTLKLDGYTLKTIQDINVKHSCRGYWPWRPGVRITFDIFEGEVIKKAFENIHQAKSVIDSWVYEN